MKTNTYKHQLLSIITKHLPQCSIYLFGSRARQEAQEGADIDLAIDNKGPIDLYVLSCIKEDVDNSNIPVFVDIVDLYKTTDQFKKTIEREWIPWKP